MCAADHMESSDDPGQGLASLAALCYLEMTGEALSTVVT